MSEVDHVSDYFCRGRMRGSKGMSGFKKILTLCYQFFLDAFFPQNVNDTVCSQTLSSIIVNF